jgi:hypothetical protein
MNLIAMQANKISKFAFTGVFVFVSLALFTGIANAQLKFDYGPKAGPNLSFFRGQMPFRDMVKPKYGLGVGGFFNMRSTKAKLFQFEANVMFSLRGNKSEYTNLDMLEKNEKIASESKNYTLGYLEFPLLCKVMLSMNENVRPYILAGPTYSGIVYSKFVGNGLELKDDDFRKFLERDDFGITAGSGICWFYLDRWYFLDLRYFHGIRNLSQNLTQNLDPYNDNVKFDEYRKDLPVFNKIAQIYNSTIMLSFGVSLSRQINLRYQ